MAISKENLILQVVVKVFSSLSFLGVMAMGYMWYRNPENFKSPTGRLIIAITITDLFDCMGMIMGLNAMYLIYFKGNVETIQKYEPLMIGMAFALPIPFSVTPLFAKPLGVQMYGDATFWCWIRPDHGIYRIYLWFMILWIIFLVNVITLALTLYGIRESEKELVQAGGGKELSKEEMKEQKKKSFGKFITKRMIAYLIAFFIVWTPSSVNRAVGFASGKPIFILNLAQSIASPSRGLINFIVYFYTWWNSPANAGRPRIGSLGSFFTLATRRESNGSLFESRRGSDRNVFISKSSSLNTVGSKSATISKIILNSNNALDDIIEKD